MTNWQYGLAYYTPGGTIEAHPEYMNDMQGLGELSIAHFFEMVGGKGWELCTFLPSKEGSNLPGCLVFKRPV
jgi:hypothetical protein